VGLARFTTGPTRSETLLARTGFTARRTVAPLGPAALAAEALTGLPVRPRPTGGPAATAAIVATFAATRFAGNDIRCGPGSATGTGTGRASPRTAPSTRRPARVAPPAMLSPLGTPELHHLHRLGGRFRIARGRGRTIDRLRHLRFGHYRRRLAGRIANEIIVGCAAFDFILLA
jgi:hypothetical protein